MQKDYNYLKKKHNKYLIFKELLKILFKQQIIVEKEYLYIILVKLVNTLKNIIQKLKLQIL